MKLFVDHNISPFLARGIGEIVVPEGHQVVALADKYARDTPDVEWIESLGDEGGWSVLSDDHRIKKIPAERAAWRRANLKGFFLAAGWRRMKTVEKAGRLLLWWPRLVEFEALVQAGSIFEVPIGWNSRLRPLPL